jgi:hypothetical protein
MRKKLFRKTASLVFAAALAVSAAAFAGCGSDKNASEETGNAAEAAENIAVATDGGSDLSDSNGALASGINTGTGNDSSSELSRSRR